MEAVTSLSPFSLHIASPREEILGLKALNNVQDI